MLAIYVRLSKEDAESNSIDHQLLQANEYKAKIPEYTNNFKIYNEGEGKSGTKDRTKRPELDKLIKDIESQIITSVWMRKQDRLARSGLIALTFAETVKNNNIYLYFGDKGHTDLNNTMVYFTFGQMALFDELKPKMQSDETIKSLRRNAEAGFVHGILPYGYKAKKMIPYVKKKQAKVINDIYDMYLKGDGTYKIANYLNKNKIPTKANKKNSYWGTTSIDNILKNTWYNGKRTYKGVKYDAPRIVDEVKHHKVQRALASRKNTKIDYTPINDILLSGLIKCYKCGRNYQGKIDNNKHFKTYMCNSKRSTTNKCGSYNISIPKFDSFIIKYLFKSRDLMIKMKAIQDSNSVVNQLEKDIETTTTKLAKATVKVNNYANLLGDALKDNTVILNKFNNAERQQTILRNALVELKSKLADSTNSEALKKYNDIYNQFDINADFNIIKEAVHSMIETITISSKHFKAPEEMNMGIFKEFHNKINYTIEIMFKGMTEKTIFFTTRPFKRWIEGATYILDEATDEITSPKGGIKLITLDKSELIDFNKKNKTINI